jgi:hypothetical protein
MHPHSKQFKGLVDNYFNPTTRQYANKASTKSKLPRANEQALRKGQRHFRTDRSLQPTKSPNGV